MLTSDQVQYIGRVAEWLASAPEAKLSYGEFYLGEVALRFDGEPAGRFVQHDETWNFYDVDEPGPNFVSSDGRGLTWTWLP